MVTNGARTTLFDSMTFQRQPSDPRTPRHFSVLWYFGGVLLHLLGSGILTGAMVYVGLAAYQESFLSGGSNFYRTLKAIIDVLFCIWNPWALFISERELSTFVVFACSWAAIVGIAIAIFAPALKNCRAVSHSSGARIS